ncbi:MAG TPA: FtsX-like permease family protein [Candidatus Limnocylindria bacterium]|nr:FtsX-like permease family protein [Candidatus Limnocylindria bacterium]
MSSLSFLLTWRYLYGTQQEKSISLMIKICFWGILIGTFSLALILSIMNGFEKITHAKLQGIHANIIVRAFGDPLNAPALEAVLKKEFPSVIAWSPTTTRQAIIQGPHHDDISNVVMVKGIDPTQEAATTHLQDKLTLQTSGTVTLADCLHNKSVIIGTGLAKRLQVNVGDPITLVYTTDEAMQGNKVAFQDHKAYVGGTFTTGVDEFDTNLVIVSLEFLHNLWPDVGIEELHIKIDPSASLEPTVTQLRDRLKLDVYSWKDLYPALVSALKLEKYAMFFILALVCLVASMNILSLAFMYITQKRGDIAILKTIGASDTVISTVFLLVSTGTALVGTIMGLVLALLAGWFLQTHPFIVLPDSYYVSQLPVVMEWHLFAGVFIFVMILSCLAAWIPVYQTRYIRIADVLRHEA